MSCLWLDIFKMLHEAPTLKQQQLFGAELCGKLIITHTFALIWLYTVDLASLAKKVVFSSRALAKKKIAACCGWKQGW